MNNIVSFVVRMDCEQICTILYIDPFCQALSLLSVEYIVFVLGTIAKRFLNFDDTSSDCYLAQWLWKLYNRMMVAFMSMTMLTILTILILSVVKGK